MGIESGGQTLKDRTSEAHIAMLYDTMRQMLESEGREALSFHTLSEIEQGLADGSLTLEGAQISDKEKFDSMFQKYQKDAEKQRQG